MTFSDTIIDELLAIFKRNGINTYSEEEIIKILDIRSSTFKELFPSRTDMVDRVVMYNNELQKQQHEKLFLTAQNPVEKIVILLKDGIKDLQNTSPKFIEDLQQVYPDAWAIVIEHFNSYSYQLIVNIINDGIVDGFFRHDIDIQLVVKIILEQLYMIMNPVAFPPAKFDMSEVFRSVYLYYIRGLCTINGEKVLDAFFSN
jgi:hypothetical protein